MGSARFATLSGRKVSIMTASSSVYFAPIVIEHDLVQSVVLFHDNREIAHLVEGSQLARNADVALGIRSALDELAVLVSVALRRPRVPLSLDDEQLRLTARRIEAIPVHDAAMQHDVIALAEREVTVLRRAASRH